MNQKGTILLETNRLILRRFVIEDSEAMYNNWAIELKEIGEVIGNISVVRVKENIECAELGYCMGTSWWGLGIMPEAGKVVIRYLFEEVGFNRIAATHDKNNPKSGRVM